MKSLGLLLSWLRKWRRGDFSRAEADRKAGGVEERRKAWLWGEDLWLGALDEEACEFGVAMKAGGRSKSPRATKAEARRVVELRPGLSGDLNVQAQVEEWLEEHMDGDKAQSTKKAYQSAWEKWCDWSRRQKWLTPYLSHKADPVENENKLLGYLGYWVLGLAWDVGGDPEAGGVRHQGRAQKGGAWGCHGQDASPVDRHQLAGEELRETPEEAGRNSVHVEVDWQQV